MAETIRDFALQVVRNLRDRGHQAYWVGGCVRDLLLERAPADYDVATDATPNQVIAIFPETYAVGAQFGVVLVPVPGTPGASVEVATFRSDGLYSDGRHPDAVRFTLKAEEDVRRRDFSINGLLLDPLQNNKVFDYVGGVADLKSGIIRAIGDPRLRFDEDKLRMLRAVRFAARFGYRIDRDTFVAIQQLAGRISQVSRERVRDELIRMLTEGRSRRAFELLDESGLLAPILPEVSKMKGVEQPPEYHPEGDVWIHTLMLLESLPENCPPALAMGALLHDVGKPPTFRRAPDRIRFDNHAEVGAKMAEEICRRYRFSNHDTGQIVALVANHMRFADTTKMRESTLKRFLRLPEFPSHLQLHRLDCLASHGDLSLYEFVRKKLEATPAQEIRPAPLLTGNDLIAAGYSPGPRFKEMLSASEDAQLEGRICDRQQALDFIRARFRAEAASAATDGSSKPTKR